MSGEEQVGTIAREWPGKTALSNLVNVEAYVA